MFRIARQLATLLRKQDSSSPLIRSGPAAEAAEREAEGVGDREVVVRAEGLVEAEQAEAVAEDRVAGPGEREAEKVERVREEGRGEARAAEAQVVEERAAEG